MKVSIIKSTPSKNGGFVNTLLVEGEQDDQLGTMIIKKRYCFKTTDEAIKEGAEPIELKDFELSRYDVNKINSTNDEGEEFTTQWLTPKQAA